jgi:hypothetical protein
MYLALFLSCIEKTLNMSDKRVSRRWLLTMGGTALTVGAAGCSMLEGKSDSGTQLPSDGDSNTDSGNSADTGSSDRGNGAPTSSYTAIDFDDPQSELEWIEGDEIVEKRLKDAIVAALIGYRKELHREIFTRSWPHKRVFTATSGKTGVGHKNP